MNLDKNLRIYRERAGYATAKEFADALDVPYNTYTAYENQKREPKLEMLIKIADLLNVSLDDLLGRTPADEDERLKKEINDLLNPNELKNLRSVTSSISIVVQSVSFSYKIIIIYWFIWNKCII